MDTKQDNQRVVIEDLRPQIDCGRFPIKRVIGDTVRVEADVFADGHDVIVCQLLHRHAEESAWQHTLMHALGNDRWQAEFTVARLGRYRYTITAWADAFLSWRGSLAKRREAGQDLGLAFRSGAQILREHAVHAKGADKEALLAYAAKLEGSLSADDKFARAHDESIAHLTLSHRDRAQATVYEKELEVVVDRERASFSAWYELFPRSTAEKSGHGSLRDCAARLPYIAKMGFDVLYLPPIHPIGQAHRKGKNNELAATAEDVGSPWAIGARDGGHKAIHASLGTFADFDHLVQKAREYGIEIALDVAFQCSPDHPYVREHPEWFRHRPDGTVQFAENPPKKYEDIYPFDFETPRWRELHAELKSVFEFWIERGVHIFRVDNPHTKPFSFWESILGELKRAHPDLIFLAEAFTRPRPMQRLAKLGFTQSYTYFTWRNTRQELTEYLTELTQGDMREYFRPNLWPNTPDILHEYLQKGGRPAFQARLVLAATLGASYGIYSGFELGESVPVKPGSEEYLDSEKYQIRPRNVDDPGSLAGLIARVNAIRREHRALQFDWSLEFHETDNPQLICYSKRAPDGSDPILVVVNLDPFNMQHGHVTLPFAAWKLPLDASVEAHDLLSDETYFWRGDSNYVRLDPQLRVAHILRLRADAPAQPVAHE
jgi:starch synthase (maltosyl-transferring)